MLIATSNGSENRQKTTLLIMAAVILTGVLTALLLMIMHRLSTRQTIQQHAQVPTGPSCPANGATCSWTFSGGEATFDYTIKDITEGDTPNARIVKKGQTPLTSVNFTPLPNHTYKCTVFAINDCGPGPSTSSANTCLSVPSPTPPLSPPTDNTPTPTKKPTPSPTLPPAVTPSPTATPTKTPTPSPTLPPAVTPTSTLTPQPTATPTPTTISFITPTPTEIIIVVRTSTPNPTTEKTPTSVQPPQAGALTPSLIMVFVGVAIITLGLIL